MGSTFLREPGWWQLMLWPPTIWRRHIDNVFLIWTGSLEELHTCMEILEILEHNNFNLVFTMNCHQSMLCNILDIQIFVNFDGSLGTTLFKPSSRNSILHATSSHPVPLISSIPDSQPEKKLQQDRALWNEGQGTPDTSYWMGYRRSCLRKTYGQEKNEDTTVLIHSKKFKPNSANVRLLITTWDNRNRFVKKCRNIGIYFWQMILYLIMSILTHKLHTEGRSHSKIG